MAVSEIGQEAWITVYSGGKFHVLDPRPEEVNIEDIAHALSLQCRFTGHVRKFYSVAEHSVMVSHLCDPEDALWGLLHDSSEAYIGDMNRPLKHTPEMSRYRTTEKNIMAAVTAHFGLPSKEPPSVKAADLRMVVTEARDLLPGGSDDWGYYRDIVRLTYRIEPWRPEDAEAMFLARFKGLTRG